MDSYKLSIAITVGLAPLAIVLGCALAIAKIPASIGRPPARHGK